MRLWANLGWGCAECSRRRVPSQNLHGLSSGVELGGPHTGAAQRVPKEPPKPSRECGECFPPPSHSWVLGVLWCDAGARSLIPLGSAAALGPPLPPPHTDPHPLGAAGVPGPPPGAASTSGVALAGGTRSVGCGARGQSHGKGVGVGVPGLGPPRGWGCGAPLCPAALPITSQFPLPCCTGCTGALPTVQG